MFSFVVGLGLLIVHACSAEPTAASALKLESLSTTTTTSTTFPGSSSSNGNGGIHDFTPSMDKRDNDGSEGSASQDKDEDDRFVSAAKCLELVEREHRQNGDSHEASTKQGQRDLATTITIIDEPAEAAGTTLSNNSSVTPDQTTAPLPSMLSMPTPQPIAATGTNFRFGAPFEFRYIFFLGGDCHNQKDWYTNFVRAGMETITEPVRPQIICPTGDKYTDNLEWNEEHGNMWWTRQFHLDALEKVVEVAGDKLNETLVITVGVGLEMDWTPVADLLRQGMAFFHAKEDPLERLGFNLTEHNLNQEDILYMYFQWDEVSAAERNGIELCRLKGGSRQLKVAKIKYGDRESAPLDYRFDIALESFRRECHEVEVIEVWEVWHNVTKESMKSTLLFNPLPDVVMTARDLHAADFLDIASEVLTKSEYAAISTVGWNNIQADLLRQHKLLITVDQLVHYPNEGIWRAIDMVVKTIQSAGLNSTTAIQKGMDRGDSMTVAADTLTISADRAGYLISGLLSGYDPNFPPYEEVKVSTGLMGVTITKMDPFEGKFEAVFWLKTSWHDPRLGWNPIVHDGELPVDPEQIWYPRLYLVNEFMHTDLYVAPVMLTYDGMATMETNIQAEFLCATTEDLKSFPFDSYNCSIDLGAPNGVTMDQSFGFYLVDSDAHYATTTSMYLEHDGHYPKEDPADHVSDVVHYYLYFERRGFTTWMRLVIPAIVINLIGFMAFYIPQ